MGVGTLIPARRPAVFLDRDGILNEAIVRDGRPYAPHSLAETRISPEVAPALARLQNAGFTLIGVTNQPDVARGTLAREVADAIVERIREALGLEALYACYHDGDTCDCRKPAPGLIVEAAREHALDLTQSWMVGDRWKDVAAAKNAGVKSVFVDRGYLEPYAGEPATVVVDSLGAAVDQILRTSPVAR